VARILDFNEERNIVGAVVRAIKFVDRVFVCDDGSADPTGEIIGDLGG